MGAKITADYTHCNGSTAQHFLFLCKIKIAIFIAHSSMSITVLPQARTSSLGDKKWSISAALVGSSIDLGHCIREVTSRVRSGRAAPFKHNALESRWHARIGNMRLLWRLLIIQREDISSGGRVLKLGADSNTIRIVFE